MEDTSPDPIPGIGQATAAWRWGGLIVGIAAAGASTCTGLLGRGLVLAAPVLGLCVLLGILGGELTVRAPAGPTRRASVAVRRTSDYLPRRLTRAVIITVGALAAVLTATTAMGSADDRGRAGRALVGHCTGTESDHRVAKTLANLLIPHDTTTYGPWMGSFYSLPLALLVLLGLAAAGFTLQRVVRRPRPGDPTHIAETDDLLRRRAARAVVGACGVLVTLPLIVVSILTAVGLLSITCHPTTWAIAAWSLIILIPAWGAVLVASALAIVVPLRPAPAPEALR